MAHQAIPAFTLENFPPLMTVTTAIPAATVIPDDNVEMVFFGSFAQGIPLLNQPFTPMVWSAPTEDQVVPEIQVPDFEEGKDDDFSFNITPLGYQNNILAPPKKRYQARISVASPERIGVPTFNSFSALEKVEARLQARRAQAARTPTKPQQNPPKPVYHTDWVTRQTKKKTEPAAAAVPETKPRQNWLKTKHPTRQKIVSSLGWVP